MSSYDIKELLEIDKIQAMFSDFHKATGYSVGIISVDGEILVNSGWQDICVNFHRKHEECLANCRQSDLTIQEHLETDNFYDYKCLNGLVDAAIPIIIGGEHLASVFFGQFFYDDDIGSEGEFLKRARKYGFDEEEYITAFRKIPVYTRDQVKKVMNFCKTVVDMITESGSKNLQLAEELEREREYEERLKIEEARYRSLVETSKDHIITLDSEGRYVYINKNAASELGSEPSEIIGKTMFDFYPETIASKQLKRVKEVIESGKSIISERYISLHEGDKSYLINMHPVRNDDGEVVLVQLVARDVTELKKVQNELEQQKSFLESIYNGTETSIFVMDVTAKGEFVYRGLNKTHERTSGFKSEQLEGKTPDDLIDFMPKEAIKEVKQHYQDCVDAGETIQYEEMIPMLGKEIWWLTTLTPLYNSKGRIYRIIGSALCINELKEVHKELENHKQNLEEMVSQQTEELTVSNEELRMEIEERIAVESSLKERVKEISCLNSINELLDDIEIDIEQVLPQIVKIIPAAWKYPEHTYCRLQIRDREYFSTDFNDTNKFLTETIKSEDEKIGEIEVHLHNGKGERDFLEEEKQLLKNISLALSNTIMRKEFTKKLRTIQQSVDNSLSGFALGNLEGEITEVNQRFIEMWNLQSENEAIGKMYMKFLADSELNRKIITGLMKYGKWEGETTALRPDGSKFDLYLAAYIVYDKKGKAIALASNFEDITERKRLSLELKQREEQYRRIFESVTDAIFIIAEDGMIVETNPAASEIYGYSKEEFLEKKVSSLIREDYHQELGRFAETLQRGEVFHGNTIDISKDGSELYSMVTGRQILFKGKPHFMAIVHDLTDLKKAQKEVDRFFEVTLSLLCIAKTDGYFKKLNPAWKELLGYDDETLLKHKFIDFVHPDDVEKTLKEVEKLSQGDITLNFSNRYRRSDGSYIWLNWNTFPRGEILYAAATDITKLKETEVRLNELMEELRSSNQELEQFAYVASHDLQEPLRKISSFTELITQRYSDKIDERGRRYMDYIVDGAQRMQKQITGLLEFSRISTRGKPFMPVDMSEVMRHVKANLELNIKDKNAKIEYQLLPEINADETQMISLFQNLTGNAVKFCKEKDPEIKIKYEDNGDKWLFSVSDNGIGIAEEFKERVFMIFQRLHDRSEYSGTGIGLAMCKKIVERHGGKIWLESEPGVVTTFYFTISKQL